MTANHTKAYLNSAQKKNWLKKSKTKVLPFFIIKVRMNSESQDEIYMVSFPLLLFFGTLPSLPDFEATINIYDATLYWFDANIAMIYPVLAIAKDTV